MLAAGVAAAKEITPHCPPPKCACANQTTPFHSARQQAICWASSWRRSLLAANPPPCRSLSGRQQGPDAAGRCWPPDWYRIGNCSSCAFCASVWPPSTGLDQDRQTVTTHPSASASPRMVNHRESTRPKSTYRSVTARRHRQRRAKAVRRAGLARSRTPSSLSRGSPSVSSIPPIAPNPQTQAGDQSQQRAVCLLQSKRQGMSWPNLPASHRPAGNRQPQTPLSTQQALCQIAWLATRQDGSLTDM